MCSGCCSWFPITPLMCRILGLDPNIPYWINAACTDDIEAVCGEVLRDEPPGTLGTIIGGPDPGQFHSQFVHDWLAVRNPNYKAIIKDLAVGHSLWSDNSDFCARNLICWASYLGWQKVTKDMPVAATLWEGPGHATFNQLRVGTLDLPCKWVYPEHRNNPYITRFINFTDYKIKL